MLSSISRVIAVIAISNLGLCSTSLGDAAGGPKAGAVHSGQEKVARVKFVGGKMAAVATTAVANTGVKSNYKLRVYDASNRLVASDDGQGSPSNIRVAVWRPEETEEFRIEFKGWDGEVDYRTN